MKRIIYNGIHSPVTRAFLAGLMDALPNIEKVFSISSEATDLSEKYTHKINRFDYYDLLVARYANENSHPLDKQILDQLGNEWFTLLKMLDRQQPDEILFLDQRLGTLNRHIRFWNSFLDQEKIDGFVCMNYPHEIFDYVIYILCKMKGIKVFIFTQTQMFGYVQLLTDIEQNDPRLQVDLSTVPLRPLPPMMEAHWKQQTIVNFQHFYMKDHLGRIARANSLAAKLKRLLGMLKRSLKNLVRYAADPRILVRVLFFKFFSGPYADKKLIQAYEKYSVDPDLNERFVYVPLHFQPECTTSPQGGYYVQQELIVQMLLKALPNDIKIFVKEHPVQKVHGRPEAFYEEIFSNPRVVAVRKSLPSKDIIAKCIAVATPTGTAGWEALFYGKPTLLFGYIFFQYAPGVFRIRKYEDCVAALGKIFSPEGVKVDHDQLKRFLLLCDQYMTRGYVDELYGPACEISEADSVKNLTQLLLNQLQAHL